MRRNELKVWEKKSKTVIHRTISKYFDMAYKNYIIRGRINFDSKTKVAHLEHYSQSIATIVGFFPPETYF